MRVTSIPPSLGHTLDRQLGVLSRSQLLAADIDDATTYRKVRTAVWRLLLPGIILVAATPPSTEQRRIAAALFAGSEAQLTGLNVLHWYGFQHAPSTDKIHLLVPHSVHRRSAGFVVVQRTLALDEHARSAGCYRVTSVARAVVDACRSMKQLTDVRAVVAEAVQAGHASAAAIDAEIRRAGRSRTGLARRALAEIVAGVRSVAEAELRDLTVRSTVLPEAMWNPVLTTLDGRRLPTPDGWIDEVGVALEVDSARYHAKDDGWIDTLDRHNALAEHDVQVLHIRPSEIRTVPWRVLATIERAYRARLASGARANVIATRARIAGGTPS